MSDRVKSSVIYVLIMLGVLTLGYFFSVVFALFWIVFSFFASAELKRLLGFRSTEALVFVGLHPIGHFLPFIFSGRSVDHALFYFMVWELFLFVILIMGRGIRIGPSSLESSINASIGGFYLAFPMFTAESILYYLDDGWLWLCLIFVTPWVSDTAAWFFGRHFGKKKAFPRLSPGKTWAGVLGALFSTMLFYLILGLTPMRSCFQNAGFELWTLPFIGLLMSFAAQLGDLFESLLKRRAGLKDSGHLIPGHGGVLDRYDSTLFVFPLFYFLFFIRALYL